MIEVTILGLLAEGPLHGYELRRTMAQPRGYARTIGDGTIYPAIARLAAAGALTQELQPGAGAAQRRTLRLTDPGSERLLQRLRDAPGHDIADPCRHDIADPCRRGIAVSVTASNRAERAWPHEELALPGTEVEEGE